jgi:DNA-binding XRE family transcriptional regulator
MGSAAADGVPDAPSPFFREVAGAVRVAGGHWPPPERTLRLKPTFAEHALAVQQTEGIFEVTDRVRARAILSVVSTINDLKHEPVTNLQLVRRSRGVSQSELAAACGVDRSAISRIERLDRNPSDALRERLATALGLAPGEKLL